MKKEPEKLKKTRNELSKKLKNKHYLNLKDFVNIWNVKAMLEFETNESTIEKVTLEAFKADTLESKLDKLFKLKGVNLSVASAILSVKYPELYSIIDGNCLAALKQEGYNIKEKIPNAKKSPSSAIELYKKFNEILTEKYRKIGKTGKSRIDVELELFEKGQKIPKKKATQL